MNHYLRTTGCAVLALACVSGSLTSCATTDSAKTKTQGTTIGVIGGALAGGAIGLLTGKDLKSALIGAASGAAMGGLAGYAWGASVVKAKEAYASTEAYLHANIEQLDTRISQARDTNAALQKDIAALRSEHKKMDAAQYATTQKQLQSNLSLMDQDISTAKTAMQDASGDELKALQSMVSNLEAEKKELSSNVRLLSQIQNA